MYGDALGELKGGLSDVDAVIGNLALVELEGCRHFTVLSGARDTTRFNLKCQWAARPGEHLPQGAHVEGEDLIDIGRRPEMSKTYLRLSRRCSNALRSIDKGSRRGP